MSVDNDEPEHRNPVSCDKNFPVGKQQKYGNGFVSKTSVSVADDKDKKAMDDHRNDSTKKELIPGDNSTAYNMVNVEVPNEMEQKSSVESVFGFSLAESKFVSTKKSLAYTETKYQNYICPDDEKHEPNPKRGSYHNNKKLNISNLDSRSGGDLQSMEVHLLEKYTNDFCNVCVVQEKNYALERDKNNHRKQSDHYRKRRTKREWCNMLNYCAKCVASPRIEESPTIVCTPCLLELRTCKPTGKYLIDKKVVAVYRVPSGDNLNKQKRRLK